MAQNNEFYINKTLNNEAIFHWFNIKSLNPKNPSAYVENELFMKAWLGYAQKCLKLIAATQQDSIKEGFPVLAWWWLLLLLPILWGLKYLLSTAKNA